MNELINNIQSSFEQMNFKLKQYIDDVKFKYKSKNDFEYNGKNKFNGIVNYLTY